MSSVAFTEQTTTDAPHKTTRTLKILKAQTERTAHGRITPGSALSGKPVNRHAELICADSVDYESPDFRRAVFYCLNRSSGLSRQNRNVPLVGKVEMSPLAEDSQNRARHSLI